jgi:hypothetical protein
MTPAKSVEYVIEEKKQEETRRETLRDATREDDFRVERATSIQLRVVGISRL